MSASSVADISLNELQSIVGGHARQATDEDAVAGILPSYVVEPGTVDEAARVMKLAGEHGLSVAPLGNRTKVQWGNPPSRLDLIVSTVRLNTVLEHAFGDLVVRVGAGVTLAHLQQELAKAGQRLSLDPPEKDGTIGGIIAANPSGPLRLRFGTVRDLIIGITVVLADGTVAKSGGKVVKNVAGYDLQKLFTGSLGTLGLVVEAFFRLHPLPPARRTVVLSSSDPDRVGEAIQALLNSTLVPSAMELIWTRTEGALAVLFEGIGPGVQAQAEAALSMVEPFGRGRIAGESEEGEVWSRLEQAWHGPVGLKIGTPIAAIPRVVNAVLVSAQDRSITWRIQSHAGNGITSVGLAGEDEQELADVVLQLRAEAARLDGHLVLNRVPSAEFAARVDAWGPVGDALPLMQRVKERFDPGNILNPGRFVGGM